jgi:hypothetical protein
MAVLVVRQVIPAGLTEAALGAAAAGGDSFALDAAKRTWLKVTNAHAANPRTVTIASQLPDGAVPPGTEKDDLDVVVPALTTKLIGPIDPLAYRDSNGRAVVTYSDAAADLTVAPFAI